MNYCTTPKSAPKPDKLKQPFIIFKLEIEWNADFSVRDLKLRRIWPWRVMFIGYILKPRLYSYVVSYNNTAWTVCLRDNIHSTHIIRFCSEVIIMT